MAAQLSPGLVITEVNLTTIVPSVVSTAGAYAGPFTWGPAGRIVTIDNEKTLISMYGAPDNNTAASFFTAASFLAYGNNLQVSRAINAASYNSTSNTSVTIQVANREVYQYSYLSGPNGNAYGPFIARHVGALGNSLTVSVIDAGSSAQAFAEWNVAVTSAGTALPNVSLAGYFNGLPSTTYKAAQQGAANDQIHIAVVDTGGLFSGTKGTVLEVYPYLSKAIDSVDSSGLSNYYKNAIFTKSNYIFAMDPVNYSATSATWGRPAANTNFATLVGSYTSTLAGGTDVTITDANIITAMNYFADPAQTTVSLLMTGPATSNTVQLAAINMASTRKDCVAFVSPPLSSVVNNANVQQDVLSWMAGLSSVTGGPKGSYGFADSGWKYMFDRYNNTYRWAPLNGDIAGLCVYTDSVNNPWWSPAGYNRGVIKNVIKLAWNPNQAGRDALYQVGINPVSSFPGQGTVLFGDKTMQTQPSAFDRINVRRLFITLEQAIAKAAQYSLFEFNDAFTQAQFVSLVTPFLRSVQAQRGITAFQVVCDSTNNTPQIIDSNTFVGDIYIQPARSINFIQLNFIAVGTGVSFSTITNTTA
jgi:Phage tail sheath protein subtilisin-like domain/Phage tail sheath C-terminal domain